MYENIIKQRMALIIAITISTTKIYLPWIMHQWHLFSMNNESAITNESESETLEKIPLPVIPYQGEKGEYILKSLRKGMRKMMSNNVKSQITFIVRKLGTTFQIKDKT